MGTSTLPLSTVVDVVVNISAQAPATPTFNQGLIVGTSVVIGSVTGAKPRLRLYTTLAEMVTDGFTTTSPEYIAASIYLSQSPAPQYIWIGRQDLTSIATLTIDVAGTGYAVGDTFNVTQASASLGTGIVTAETAGVPSAIAIVPGSQGTGYSVATALPTTTLTGSGAGLEVNITAIGESALQALQACRLASPAWWACAVLAAVDADHIAIGTWAQAITPQLCYFYTSGTAASLNGTTGNVFSVLKAGNYTRAFGIYSTTQSGLAPNNIYSQSAAMGVCMGLNTGLAGSQFTMKFKELVGIAVEPLSLTQINLLETNNANLYLSYANSYSWIEQGVVASGQFLDTILGVDMLASDYQYSVVDLLTENPSIGQDNAGQTQILNVINQANARAATRGFLAPGTWGGATILNLVAGTSLPSGYLSQSAPYTVPPPANRQAMPIYVAIILAGAVHSVLINVNVQQ
jgi:hypothetical protein